MKLDEESTLEETARERLEVWLATQPLTGGLQSPPVSPGLENLTLPLIRGNRRVGVDSLQTCVSHPRGVLQPSLFAELGHPPILSPPPSPVFGNLHTVQASLLAGSGLRQGAPYVLGSNLLLPQGTGNLLSQLNGDNPLLVESGRAHTSGLQSSHPRRLVQRRGALARLGFFQDLNNNVPRARTQSNRTQPLPIKIPRRRRAFRVGMSSTPAGRRRLAQRYIRNGGAPHGSTLLSDEMREKNTSKDSKLNQGENKGKLKKFLVSRCPSPDIVEDLPHCILSSEKDAEEGQACILPNTLSAPPVVYIETETGSLKSAHFDSEKTSDDSGKESDSEITARNDELQENRLDIEEDEEEREEEEEEEEFMFDFDDNKSQKSPLLPRSALKKDGQSKNKDAISKLKKADPDDDAFLELYKQRKRPSISFALSDQSDNEDDEAEKYLAPPPKSLLGRRLSACSSIPEEELKPLSVSTVERTRSVSECSDSLSVKSFSNSESSKPSSAMLNARRNSRQFTIVNYGDVNCTPGPGPAPSGPSLRRPSVQLTVPGINLVDASNGASVTSIQSNGSARSSSSRRLLRQLSSEDSRIQARPMLMPPAHARMGGYSRFASHRGSILPQTGVTIPEVAKRGLMFAQRKKQRLVSKIGNFNIDYTNIMKKNQSYLADFFTTVLDMKWRYTLLIFMFTFCMSWVTFAVLWWIITFIRGDHGNRKEQYCVHAVYDFTTALLYSVETQHTIGYGVRAVTPNCPEAILLLMVQSLFGVIIQCVMAGFVLAKLARPKYRAETIMFSKNAVICQEDGEFCLLFRVGDMRRSQLVGAMLHAMFVKKRKTQEGEEIPFYQYHLEVTAESEDYDQFIFLSWPIRVMHRINETSPFWNVSAEQLLMEDFEIIVVLEGVVEATGMTTQVRTSYLPSEILWAHRLSPLLTLRKDNGRFEIDYGRFHKVAPVIMPDESAREVFEQQLKDEEDEFDKYGSRRTLPSTNNFSSRNTVYS